MGRLSHELRTPLTICAGRNEVALDRRPPEPVKQLLEDNLADIDNIVSLLNTLLSLARLDSRMETVSSQLWTWFRILRDLIEELDPLWEEKQIHFDYGWRKNDLGRMPAARRHRRRLSAPPGFSQPAHQRVQVHARLGEASDFSSKPPARASRRSGALWSATPVPPFPKKPSKWCSRGFLPRRGSASPSGSARTAPRVFSRPVFGLGLQHRQSPVVRTAERTHRAFNPRRAPREYSEAPPPRPCLQ